MRPPRRFFPSSNPTPSIRVADTGAWTYNAMEDCLLAGREVAVTIEAVPGARHHDQPVPVRRQAACLHRDPGLQREGILRGSVLELREKLRPFGSPMN